MFYEKSVKHGLDLKEQKLKKEARKEGRNAGDPRGQKVKGGVAEDSAVCWKNGSVKDEKEEVKSRGLGVGFVWCFVVGAGGGLVGCFAKVSNRCFVPNPNSTVN